MWFLPSVLDRDDHPGAIVAAGTPSAPPVAAQAASDLVSLMLVLDVSGRYGIPGPVPRSRSMTARRLSDPYRRHE